MVDELDLERRLRCRIGHLEAYSITNKLKYLKKSTDAFDLDFADELSLGFNVLLGAIERLEAELNCANAEVVRLSDEFRAVEVSAEGE